MKLQVQFKDYIDALRADANKPLELDTILKPFGISHAAAGSDNLLVGHLLDAIAEERGGADLIDAIDVARTAYDLGHAEAGLFLNDAPLIMAQMSLRH